MVGKEEKEDSSERQWEEFMMCGLALEVCMRLGHLGIGCEGVYGLGSLWRVVWCMVIGVIGVVKV